MKRVFYLVAALVAAVSCSDADVDLATPDLDGDVGGSGDMRSVVINASLESEGADTRLSLDDETWCFTWEDGDALMAWSQTSGAITKLTHTYEGVFDSNAVTFSGSVTASSSFRLIYPYESASISEGKYTISYATQTEGGNNPYMVNGALLTETEDSYNAVMYQVGAALQLNLTFPESVTGDISITVKGFNSVATIDLTKSIDNANFYSALTSDDDITVTCSETISGEYTATAILNIMPTTLADGDMIQVKTTIGDNTYYWAYTHSGDDLEFERATYNTLKCDLVSVSPTQPTTGDGNTTPYEITTAAELFWIAQEANAAAGTTNLNCKLMNNINLLGLDWTPIGDSSNNYTGTFDGDGHTISGLYINTSATYLGLFGYTSDATIKNLTVSGSVTNNDNSSYDSFTGGIVGYAKATTISNCTNNGVIKGKIYVGGIVGRFYSNGSYDIVGCANTQSVTGSSYYVGGVVGYIRTFVESSGDTTNILNCSNSGSISSSSGSYVGGIVGANAIGYSNNTNGASYSYVVNIYNCYNVGETLSVNSNYVGGIVGYTILYKNVSGTTPLTVSNCYSASTLSGTTLGGVMGGLTNSNGYTVTFANCYWNKTLYVANDDAYGTGMDTSAMTTVAGSGSDFYTTLNTNAEALNSGALSSSATKACAWTQVDGSYPTLDLSSVAGSN